MGTGVEGVGLLGCGRGRRGADAFRRFILLLVDARCTLTLGNNFGLSWEVLGLESELEMKVTDFHTLMKGGKTCFNLPHVISYSPAILRSVWIWWQGSLGKTSSGSRCGA